MRLVTHAVVLIRSERGALPHLGGRLADLDGVAEAYSVTGEWDFVAIVRVADPEDLANSVTERIARLEGIERTYTMVAFEVYSRHDLEAMFSIGERGER
jgi:DNA-binding Lrp family transcriptional regulator